MTTALVDWLVVNKDKVERAVEIVGQASEVLASTVGQLHPILEAVFMASAEILGNPEGKEARYLTEQFEQVNLKLELLQAEQEQIGRELERSSMNKQSFDREAQMLSQYEKFQEFINAKPKFKAKKKEKFLSHFENTDGDLNLDALYNAVIGEDITGAPMLENVVSVEARGRRAVEGFCASLKKLFVVGIFAVMGHAALKEGKIDPEMVKKWQDRMERVEILMKAAVDDCTQNFAEQAKADTEHELLDKTGSLSRDFIKPILASLVKKYDWVSWSVRVLRAEEWFLYSWVVGKKFSGWAGGENYFEATTKNKFMVEVSFCVEPAALDQTHIRKAVEGQKLKGNMVDVAATLSGNVPDCLVHAIHSGKDVVEDNNFKPECYYFIKHKKAYVCIHPL
ncbi:rapunzel 5 [Gadus chalcogrammus]|uniref:rapunzel 5 n=1 Tax=Gadus chalcogrammus TaxID=1042646 RepID=UPI0024C29965|nr:rapunzel 5 [Gadus chalcogrammus]XP_056448479.1 rapunzel 5 [Gadus chalcogrammus]